MPIALTQKIYELTFNDVVGEQYHFPRAYWSYISTGVRFIYYHPYEVDDPNRYYFGTGIVGEVRPDHKDPDHRYADILEYEPFPATVPYKVNGSYLEARPNIGTQFFRSVRLIDDSLFAQILHHTGLGIDHAPGIQETDNLDEILAKFNKRYENLRPKTYQRLIREIDRPTVVSRALKEKLGYRCQICSFEGFEKKSGGKYAEAHHLQWLHLQLPNSLVTENIVIVCANCHRQLHYADVEITLLDSSAVEVQINGNVYRLQRNVI